MTAADFSPDIARLNEIAELLIERGLKAEAIVGEDYYPLLAIIVTDPNEPRVQWDFLMNADEHGLWIHQMGAQYGDEYEGVYFEKFAIDTPMDTPANEVALRIQQTIAVGIEPEGVEKIVEHYEYFRLNASE